ncbi:Ig-like domain-containing protein [Oceanicoccus sp. KOV_DT_Chl]|uniref:Ig-like domain-containing protein n=1 Tax=Oceanicoccus sp. KOV_DT_Chl TaxID=1904639 RepID=UPI000C7A54CA|nr:Ig-like domain-containing protein [Oceanicoccus sp. KOV_DT_Chl]
MLKLKDFLIHQSRLSIAVLLLLGLVGCGSGGGSDNILCGGDPCATSEDDDAEDSTNEIENIVDQGSPDSIQFVSASPQLISIRSAGGDETSIVTFLVTDTAGDPIEGVPVSFTIDNTIGGISLSNTLDETNANGEAAVIVQSGTVHTTVSVTATVVSTQDSTVSPSLSISTGIPDFNSFSLALDVFNPLAWNLDGSVVNATVRLADFFNNPPPDGTQVTFYTEGGRIAASCSSVGGDCSAEWVGTNPRATQGDGDRLGRSAVLAVVTGAESFQDTNSNGVFDDGDIFTTADDQPEPWLDNNENGIFDSGEFYVDFNENGMRDVADGLYNGPLCSHSSLCSANKTIALGEQHLIVMASSVFSIQSATLAADFGPDGDLDIGAGGRTYFVTVGDENGNTLPFESSIAVSATNGVVDGGGIDIASNAYEPVTFSIFIAPDDTSSADGFLKIAITVPVNADETLTTVLSYPVSD